MVQISHPDQFRIASLVKILAEYGYPVRWSPTAPTLLMTEATRQKVDGLWRKFEKAARWFPNPQTTEIDTLPPETETGQAALF